MKKVIKFLTNTFIYITTHHYRLKWDKLAHFYTASLGFAMFETFFGDIYASIIVVSVAIITEILHYFDTKRNSEIADAFMSCLPVIIYWLIKLI